jgi:thiamine biosynthesis lipoprotein
MGTTLRVAARGQQAEQAIERAIQVIHEADQRWSSWRSDSLISQIHASAPGAKVPVDDEFQAGWTLARSWSKQTKGAFNPALGSLLSLWGIQKDGPHASPSQTDLDLARQAAHPRCFQIEGNQIVRSHTNAQISEGGFVKGLALDQAIQIIRDEFPQLERLSFDFGGQLAWWHHPDDSNPSKISLVANPLDRSQTVASIAHGSEGSLATSGNSERGKVIDGQRRSHILDPRTGKPVRDWGSVTVLISDAEGGAACAADCLSTALFVLGPSAGRALANQLPGVEALFLEKTQDGLRWHTTDGMQSRLRRIQGTENP